MKTAFMVTRGLLGILGAAQLILGVVFWTGHATSWVQLHMAIGVLFVLALWTLAVLGGRAGAPIGLVAVTLGWGVLLAVLGMTQMQLLPGPAHWVIRVVHLLTGIIAMGLGGALSARTRISAGGAHRSPGLVVDRAMEQKRA